LKEAAEKSEVELSSSMKLNHTANGWLQDQNTVKKIN
jgi:hypothetical protein